ncbi:MAG: bifunctional phosphoglucose/phosphomannose isomerase [Candidatus Doudnabacteria bacterium]|nr:bifunctional phosphoglucose/phosphomannose isomerase [Candidatus Doudnabacteria bacterium]
MMRDAILNFPKQFKYRPKIENGPVKKYKRYVVAGMGGSHLAADILKSLKPDLDLTVHMDYGLPEKDLQKTLVIASSYSGNTEETIDAFEQARNKGSALAAVASGGKLIELAVQHKVPYILLPQAVSEPRMALGLSLRALLKLTKQNEFLKESALLIKILKPQELELQGRALAEKIKGKVPVIYASARNEAVAYNWKIKFNETGKIPAFCNVLPELNHNEINGFDIKEATKSLGTWAHFIFLKDSEDHPRNQKRMEITAKLYQERGLPVEVIELSGDSRLEQIFKSLLLADWTAIYTAQNYGLKPEGQPMVDEFKKLII